MDTKQHTPDKVYWNKREVADLLAVNAELLAALSEISEHGQCLPGQPCEWGPEKMAKVARTAIAKARS